jgi:hypothetical protein
MLKKDAVARERRASNSGCADMGKQGRRNKTAHGNAGFQPKSAGQQLFQYAPAGLIVRLTGSAGTGRRC